MDFSVEIAWFIIPSILCYENTLLPRSVECSRIFILVLYIWQNFHTYGKIYRNKRINKEHPNTNKQGLGLRLELGLGPGVYWWLREAFARLFFEAVQGCSGVHGFSPSFTTCPSLARKWSWKITI